MCGSWVDMPGGREQAALLAVLCRASQARLLGRHTLHTSISPCALRTTPNQSASHLCLRLLNMAAWSADSARAAGGRMELPPAREARSALLSCGSRRLELSLPLNVVPRVCCLSRGVLIPRDPAGESGHTRLLPATRLSRSTLAGVCGGALHTVSQQEGSNTASCSVLKAHLNSLNKQGLVGGRAVNWLARKRGLSND